MPRFEHISNVEPRIDAPQDLVGKRVMFDDKKRIGMVLKPDPKNTAHVIVQCGENDTWSVHWLTVSVEIAHD